MLAGWVVKHFNVIEYVLPCSVLCHADAPPDPLAFKELKEALGDPIAIAAYRSAHPCGQIVFVEERLLLFVSEL